MLRMIGASAILLSGISACAPTGDDAVPEVTVERSGAGDAVFIGIESDNIVSGRRPKLTLVCTSGKAPEIILDLVQTAATPPPRRGVFAQMQVRGGPEVTIELGWFENSNWVARLPHPAQPESDTEDRENQRRLLAILYAFSRDRRLTITPPANYGPGEKLVWSPQTYAPQAAAVRACTAIAAPPELPPL